jgi:hypothetical protein
MEHHFVKDDDMNSLGTSYDYASVMHFASRAFALDHRYPTIIQLRDTDKYPIGQRDHISAGDIVRMRRLYGCDS